MKKRFFIAASAAFGVALFILILWLPGKYVVPILMYHSVDYARTDRARLNTVSPEVFDRQMGYLKKNGYRVLSLDEYIKTLASGQKFARNSVVITFDDGLLNNYTYAYPILKKYGLPAAIFVPSGFIGRIDDEMGGPLMTWNQLREVSANGVLIESHTVTHAYLPSVGLDVAKQEMVNSKAALEKGLGRPVNYLAYPTSGFSGDIKRIAKEAGYAAAFTTNRGFDRSNKDVFELKRIRPNNSDGMFVFWVKISGYYNLIRSSKSGY